MAKKNNTLRQVSCQIRPETNKKVLKLIARLKKKSGIKPSKVDTFDLAFDLALKHVDDK